MTELAAEADAANDDLTVHDDSAAVAGADDAGDGGGFVVEAEEVVVAPERGCVGVIEIDDGLAENFFESTAHVEVAPVGVDEVGGAFGAEFSGGAGGAGRVKADDGDVAELDAGFFDGDLEAVGNLLEADGWAFGGAGRVLAETIDEELFLVVEKSVVDGSAAQINTSN